ncbi:MAG TPA: hypothetical protein VM511_01735 [Luteolibacter sp.]|jgi:hypothetical protein|nr:hypothetical protein [Luteolibacter sp.]
MKTSLRKNIVMVIGATICAAAMTFAGPYEKGDAVSSFKAEDQHGKAFTFESGNTRYLLVSHDMETGKKANAALSNLGKDHLDDKKAVYVANIVGMPGIGRMFAIPKMKKYSHRIILGDDEALIAKFPQQAGKVTVLKLSGGKVAGISYWIPGTESVDDYLK